MKIKIEKKRIIISSLILFLTLFMFLPVVKCIDEYPVKEKFCKQYHQCSVDIYHPLSLIVMNYDDGFYCPGRNLNTFWILIISFLELSISVFISLAISLYYEKYRNI